MRSLTHSFHSIHNNASSRPDCRVVGVHYTTAMHLYKRTDLHSEVMGDPVQRQRVYYERYGNGGTRNYSKFSNINEVSEIYQPSHPAPTFQLPAVLLNSSDWNVRVVQVEEEVTSDLLELVYHKESKDHVWMYVFPQLFNDEDENHHQGEFNPTVQELRKSGLETVSLTVTPTSSTRSLEVCQNGGSGRHNPVIKVHCPYKISRYWRPMRRDIVTHCIAICKELRRVLLLLDDVRKGQFKMLSEMIGVTFGGEDGWGYVIRESKPFPYDTSETSTTLIPMFALYGQDILDPSAPVLLKQIVDRAHRLQQNGDDKQLLAKEIVLKKVIFPIITFWVMVYKEGGLLLELHGQNTLLEMDVDGLLNGGVVYRDLMLTVDKDVRKKKGLSNEGFARRRLVSRSQTMSLENRLGEALLSIGYDKSIGILNFDQLAKAAEDIFHIPPNELHKEAQSHFQAQFPDFRDYFPAKLDDVWGYSDEIENSYDVTLLKGEKPRWRPCH